MTETSTTLLEQQATKLPLQADSSPNSNRTASHSTKSVPPSSQQFNQLQGRSYSTSTLAEPKKMVSPNHLRACQTSTKSATVDLSKCFPKCFEKGKMVFLGSSTDLPPVAVVGYLSAKVRYRR